MRFRIANPLKWRCRVATSVETAVAMVTTMLVTVFFLALVAVPEAVYVQTAWNTPDVARVTAPAVIIA